MTIEELGRMADEYAKEIAPDNKEAQAAISADSLGFLNKVMEKCCLVEKSEVERIYNLNKRRLHATHGLTSASVVELLESLFPEIAKEVEG